MAPKARGRQQEDDDDDDEEVTFTPRQQQEIGKIVNAAVGGQLSRKLGAAVDKSLSGLEERLAERLTGKKATATPDDDGDDDADDPPAERTPAKRGKAKTSTGNDSASRELNAKIEAQNKKIAQMEQERQQERQQLEARDRDDKIGGALKAVGVDPNRMRGAIAVLRETFTVKKSEDGSYLAKVQRDGYDEEIPVEKAAKEWAGTDEGRAYLADQKRQGGGAPRQGGVINVIGSGGGTKAAGVNGGAAGKAQAAEAKVERREAAMNKLAGAVNELTGGASIDM